MGIVYKAKQSSLNRLVALKMILRGAFATPKDIARFRAEAESAAQLDHPHIVPIYEVGDHEGQQYFSMKFVEGASLANHPRGDARAEVVGLIDVIRAVHHAHQRGVLHRDLKPSNVLVDSNGNRLVTDFGLAKRLSDTDRSLTEAGAVLGTPRYMSPEQAAGRKDLTVAADVYSLGVMLYERLTGRTPFIGDNVLTLLRQVRELEPPRLSWIRPQLDKDLETVVLKCLEKEPSSRYDAAESLAEDLRNWLAFRPITARPVGQSERFWRWCKRNPAVASSLGAAVLALVSTVLVSMAFAIVRTQAAARSDAAYQRLKHYSIQAQTHAADTLSGQGSSLIRSGDTVAGLFQLVRALEIAPPEREDIQLPVRRAIAAATMQFREAARHVDGDAYFATAAFGADGRFLATGDHDGVARIYETPSGKLLHQLTLFRNGGCQRIAFRRDGSALASTNGAEIRTWSLTAKRELGPPITLCTLGSRNSVFDAPSLETSPVLSLKITDISFAEDNASILAVAEYEDDYFENRGIARLWDLGSGKPAGPVLTWESQEEGAAFRPDGSVAVIADHDKGSARLIDMRTGQIRGRAISVEPGTLGTPTFRPDSKVVAFLADGHIRIYDVDTAKCISSSTSTRQGTPRGYAPYFSRDGRSLFSYDVNASFCIWDVGAQSGRNIIPTNPELQHTGQPFDSGTIAFTNDADGCVMFDTGTGRLLAIMHPLIQSAVAFEPTGPNIVLLNLYKPMKCRREASLFDSEAWSLAPIVGPPDIIREWAELLARTEIRETNQVETLKEGPWQARRQELRRKLVTAQVSEIVQRIANDKLYWERCELRLSEESGRWNEAVQLLKRLIEAEPMQWRYHQRLGNALGWLGRYLDAAVSFLRAREIGGSDTEKDLNWWTCAGLSLLASGNEQAHLMLCQEMLERVGQPRQGNWSLVLLTSGALRLLPVSHLSMNF